MPTIEDLAAELRELRRRVDAAESVLRIQDLKADYARLIDERFSKGRRVEAGRLEQIADQIAMLFVPDGVWDGGPTFGLARGRREIAGMLRETTLDFSVHLFVQPRISVEEDHATGRWELLCPCRRPDGTSYWMCGFETDEYLRVDGEWLFRSMRLTTVLMSPVADGWTKIYR